MAHLGSSSHTTSLQAETGIQLALSLRSGCEVSDQAHTRHTENKQESSTALPNTNQPQKDEGLLQDTGAPQGKESPLGPAPKGSLCQVPGSCSEDFC